jgi:hypothetical protein
MLALKFQRRIPKFGGGLIFRKVLPPTLLSYLMDRTLNTCKG